MSVLMREARADVRGEAEHGSIREVTLVGRPPDGRGPAGRVVVGGRPYRVVAESSRYLHLRPDSAGRA